MSFWREASSVILLTKSSNITNVKTMCWDPLRVLCMKRSEIISYLPNVIVFPGGTTEKSDSSIEWAKIIPGCSKLNLNLNIVGYNGNSAIKFVKDNEAGSISKELSLRITAIRETFEESGILLCKKVSTDSADTDCVLCSHLEIESIDNWRKLVQKNSSNFIDLCNKNNCYPNVKALQIWSNWLSPPISKSSFDTKFFVAIIDSPVNSTPDGTEISKIEWNTPDEILSRFESGNEILVTPQFYELSRLKNFISFEELTNFVTTRNGHECEQMIPKIVVTKDGILSLLPGDGVYDNFNGGMKIHSTDKYIKHFDAHIMHRLYFSKTFLPKKLVVSNYVPKYGHIVPFITKPHSKL
ncbi:acyl-coenzyme A diphosphatase NUDT19-like [Adelges cooleyi]|uniref:acyl-coenzyme A diphosphatase NUDT19-like n=1 Tax=Adelges cooleyi TaxID=133065 RepID=UPI0021804B06|nr:acyl-coenzyme A diphosphatase NUDT19-like [Adelges cooleyi]